MPFCDILWTKSIKIHQHTKKIWFSNSDLFGLCTKKEWMASGKVRKTSSFYLFHCMHRGRVYYHLSGYQMRDIIKQINIKEYKVVICQIYIFSCISTVMQERAVKVSYCRLHLWQELQKLLIWVASTSSLFNYSNPPTDISASYIHSLLKPPPLLAVATVQASVTSMATPAPNNAQATSASL